MNPLPATKQKRKRSRMACATCHSRKVRCSVEDGFPCHNCRTDGIRCCLPEHRRKRPRRPDISTSEDGASPNTQSFGHGLVISYHTDKELEQSMSPEGMSQSHTLDESRDVNIAGAKPWELPPTPSPSVAAENRSCSRHWTASTLHCPVPSSLPTKNRPSSVCNGESKNTHGQTHVPFNTSLEPEIGQSQMPNPCLRGSSDLNLAEGGDLDQCQSRFQASKKAQRINTEGDNATFQIILSLANNLAKLAYNMSLLQKQCHMSHTRCDCQEHSAQALHPSSCDNAEYSTQQCQKRKCDAPELDSCLISPFDTSKSNPGIFDDDEIRLENLLTEGWPAADIGEDLGYH